MAARTKGLSAKFVEAAKRPGLFGDGGGLYLQVTGETSKAWIFRFTAPDGRRRDMGLGSASVITLAAARDLAHAAKRQVAAGVDPIEARRAEAAAKAVEAAKATTFREAAAAYLALNEAGWKSKKHAGQWAATLDAYAHPLIGDLPVAAVDTGLVLKILQPIWLAKPETAARIRGRIETILDFAKVSGWRAGENPARWKGHLQNALPARGKVAAVVHHAALPYADMPAFWPRLQLHDGMAARALELLILTACRSGEVLGARWPEIDLDGAVWTIPAERMKGGREHRVPLTEPAVALLRKLAAAKVNDYVFPGQRKDRPLSNMAPAMTLRRLKLDVTAHGFRSTFRTWAAEQTSFPDPVCEAALAHAVPDNVVAAYRRSDFFDRRRKLMEAWATFVSTPATDRVVRFGGRGRG